VARSADPAAPDGHGRRQIDDHDHVIVDKSMISGWPAPNTPLIVDKSMIMRA
jgi:hypothetical protein